MQDPGADGAGWGLFEPHQLCAGKPWGSSGETRRSQTLNPQILRPVEQDPGFWLLPLTFPFKEHASGILSCSQVFQEF